MGNRKLNLSNINSINDFQILCQKKENIKDIINDRKPILKSGSTSEETGNLLKDGDIYKFLIFDLPRVITCSYATNLCKKTCFQEAVEANYPKENGESDAKNLRKEKLIKSLDDTFIEKIIFEIRNKLQNNPESKFIVRIHGDGDFYNVEYLMKWIEISLRVKYSRYYINQMSLFKGIENTKIFFVAYTKSLKYLVDIFINDKYLKELVVLINDIIGETKGSELESKLKSSNNIGETISNLIKEYIPINFIASIMDKSGDKNENDENDQNDENNELNKLLNNELKLYKYTVTKGDIVEDENFCDIANTKCKEGSCLKCYPPSRDMITRLRSKNESRNDYNNEDTIVICKDNSKLKEKQWRVTFIKDEIRDNLKYLAVYLEKDTIKYIWEIENIYKDKENIIITTKDKEKSVEIEKSPDVIVQGHRYTYYSKIESAKKMSDIF